jgi:hypothetical protein
VDSRRSRDTTILQLSLRKPAGRPFVLLLIKLVWAWEQPIFVDFCRRITSFGRLILFDKRGTGLSDRPRDLPTPIRGCKT